MNVSKHVAGISGQQLGERLLVFPTDECEPVRILKGPPSL